jgi:DNA polymerase III alpha subunit
LISIGFFSHLPESRQQMLDQFDTWNSLTKKEQEWAVDSYSKYKNLTILLKAMTPTKKKGGATFNANRSSILKDLVYHLENPAYSLKDDPEWVIRTEENYLGVSLTYSRIEIYDTHLADTNIREFIDGKKKSNAKIAVTISEVRRYTIKSGKMEGLEMAFLCVEDDTGTLDTVTIFSEKWKEYKSQLYEGNNVILCRASSRRKGRRMDDGFIVDRVIELG